MAKKHKYKSSRKKRGGSVGIVIVLFLSLAVLGLTLALLFPQIGEWLGGEVPQEESSAPTPDTTTTTTKAASIGFFVTTDQLNMRSGPGTEYEVLGVLPTGETVEVLAVEGDWYRIALGGDTAYIHADYVVPSTPESTTTTTHSETTASTTQAGPSGEVYLDADGLLQFKTDGRYVQKDSYTADSEIPWNLRLVNDWNAIPSDYSEDGLTEILGDAGRQRVDKRILEDLKAMIEAGKAYNIGVQSGYRSVAKQKELYWRQVNKQPQTLTEIQAQKAAGQIVKRPGYSEHHTGLAVDLYGSGDYSLTETFENTAAFRWLMENCAEYGFVLRFPKNKEGATGVIYEPWHFRYVGREAAKEIMEKGLCLEEYLQEKKQ